MSEPPRKVRTGLIPDPDNAPVVFANLFGGGGTVNNVINFALCVARFTPTFEGPVDSDLVVAARIRLDVDTAVVLRNFLSAQIEMLTVPKEKPN